MRYVVTGTSPTGSKLYVMEDGRMSPSVAEAASFSHSEKWMADDIARRPDLLQARALGADKQLIVEVLS